MSDPAATIPLHDLLGFSHDAYVPGSHHAEVRMPLRPEAFGFTGNLHGGAIATMVDLVCALAAAQATQFDAQVESLVTADMHVRYVGRPSGGTHVVASADVVRIGSQLIVIECKVTDEGGHLVALADMSMMRVSRRTPLLPG